jgi:hypothetical protein
VDRSGHLHQRHRVRGRRRDARRQLGQPRPAVAAEVLQDHVVAGPGPKRGVDVVAVPEAVDEAGLERLGGEQRRAVDQAPHGIRVEVPVGRDGRNELFRHRIHDPFCRLAVSGSEPPLGEDVGGVLVLVALRELGCDPGLVEHAPQERHLGGDAGDADVAGRLQPDLLEARRQDVRDAGVPELTEGLGPRDRDLAVVPHVPDRVLELLGLREAQHRPRPAELDHQGPDPGIPRRTAHALLDRP